MPQKEAVMALIRLDHDRVNALMREARLRPVDLGDMLKLSRQMANFILHKGGTKYAGKLARIFGCTEKELLVCAGERKEPIKRGRKANGRTSERSK
jgi:hypothetical protein